MHGAVGVVDRLLRVAEDERPARLLARVVAGVGARHHEAVGERRRAVGVGRQIQRIAGETAVARHVEAAIPAIRQVDFERDLGGDHAGHPAMLRRISGGRHHARRYRDDAVALERRQTFARLGWARVRDRVVRQGAAGIGKRLRRGRRGGGAHESEDIEEAHDGSFHGMRRYSAITPDRPNLAYPAARMVKKKTVRRKKQAAASIGLTPAESRTGISAAEALTPVVERDGGAVLGAYRDPFGGNTDPDCLAADRPRRADALSARPVGSARQAADEGD